MARFFKWLAGGIAILCVLATVAVAVFYATADDSKKAQLKALIVGPSRTSSYDEWLSAYTQHYYIALPISQCFQGIKLLSSNSQEINMSLMVGLQPDGTYQFGQSEPNGPEIRLNNYQVSLIYLSDAISRARLAAAAENVTNRSRMNMFEWTLVVIGAITTILISIKSMANAQSPRYVTIGILAIIFSALGTAGTSLNAFFSPGDAFTRSERTLLQLRKLHTDISAYVAAHSGDLCMTMTADDQAEPKSKAVKEFWDRLGQIVSAPGSAATTQAAGPTQSGTPIANKP